MQWKLLKEKYKRVKQTFEKTRSGNAATPKVKAWSLFPAMQFIEPHISVRQSVIYF